MYHMQAAIFLFGILWGTIAMALGTDFNQDTREAFKKSINYPALVAAHPQEKTVTLDWHKALQNLKDAQGTVWTSTPAEPGLGGTGEGQLRLNLQSSKGEAIVEIISLDGDWQERLDYVIAKKSLTDRIDVNSKLVPGIEDIYFIPKTGTEVPFTSFLYGNLFIDISQWDANDIDALAKAIYQLVKNNSQPAVEAKPAFKINVDKCQLNIGDTVKINVEGLVKDWTSEWIYNQPQLLLGNELEYLEQDGDTFFFKAVKAGKIEVTFAALNTRTLYVEKQSVAVEIR
ncbi:MAG: hypothetical protein B0W54_15210 [Cellvibrio sp. 79]|nr:MAG: hypothetical protein B0W54_15210 [Cellvibrio sp. 79]